MYTQTLYACVCVYVSTVEPARGMDGYAGAFSCRPCKGRQALLFRFKALYYMLPYQDAMRGSHSPRST